MPLGDIYGLTGSAERAGQEVITKALKMRIGANLPPVLWPEAFMAVIYLYNILPLVKYDMKLLNETLNL